MAARTRPPFGTLLRQLRQRRGCSQLALSTEAGISTRHLSFVETGRSRPSREMVLRLAATLELPLRDCNALLTAAGFAAAWSETDLDQPEMGPLLRMLRFLLRQLDPYPAFLIDRCYRVLDANAAGGRTFGLLGNEAPVWREQPANLLRLTLHPDGLRPHIVNWAQVAGALVGRLHRDVAMAGEDSEVARLRGELLALPDLPDAFQFPDLEEPALPVLPLHIKMGELELRLFSTLTSVGTPQDVTAQELHVEAFMAADAASETLLRALAGGS